MCYVQCTLFKNVKLNTIKRALDLLCMAVDPVCRAVELDPVFKVNLDPAYRAVDLDPAFRVVDLDPIGRALDLYPVIVYPWFLILYEYLLM